MKPNFKLFATLSLLLVAGLILAACQPQTIVETVEVEVPGEEVIVEVPAVGDDLDAIISADGMIECQPLPDMAFDTTGETVASVTSVPVQASGASAPVASEAAQGGGVYRVGIFEDMTTTNFWAANGPDNTVWNSYIQSPQYVSAYGLSHQSLQWVPNIAVGEGPAPVEEGDVWTITITLREDVTWSDGEQLTAEDWAFTAQTVLDFGLISGGWTAWYDSNLLVGIEAVDDFTAKLIFNEAPGLISQHNVWGSPILAEHYWAPVVAEAGAGLEGLEGDDLFAAQADAQDILFAHQPEGEPFAGSYTLGQREPGAFVTNDPYASYYGEGQTITIYENGAFQSVELDGTTFTAYGEPEGEPLVEVTEGPFFDSVLYTIYSSQDAALLALKNGDIDFVLNPLGLQRGLLDQVQGDENISIVENGVNGFRYMSFNVRREPMNYCSFRQAVAVLIDKEFVTGTILQGVAFPLYSYVPEANGAWYKDDVPKLGFGLDREQRVELAKAILRQDGFTWEGGVEPVFNVDAGSVDPGGRLLLPSGAPVPNLTLLSPPPSYDPLRSTFAVWIESWLNEFGIPAEADLIGFNVSIPIIFTEQDFDMYILGWSLGQDPDYLRDFFHSEQAVEDGNNAGGYSNPDFDAAADAIFTCQTFEECKEISDQLQLTLSTETPYVLLFDTGIIEAYRSSGIDFPYTSSLSGLQWTGNPGGPAMVNVAKVK